MGGKENEALLETFYEQSREFGSKLVARFVDDKDAAATMAEAAEIFQRILPGMAYLGTPKHPMAASVFGANAILSVYLSLSTRGVDLHDFGRAILAVMEQAPVPEPTSEQRKDTRTQQEQFADFIAAAESSQEQAKPNEFVFEVFLGNDGDLDWGMNIKSCAICSSFSKYDAMDLVPYMCATDDVASDNGKDGLRRTGTIAVGAHQCDFRYKKGGDPQRIAEAYPERIRVTNI